MTERDDSTNAPPSGDLPSRNDFGLPPELLQWHRDYARAQQQVRIFAFPCRRCGGTFEIKRRGYSRSRRPTICPECIRLANIKNARRWRERRRQKRVLLQLTRACQQCHGAMPDGRTDRAYCSPACRQKGQLCT
jgi:hypothetical protein